MPNDTMEQKKKGYPFVCTECGKEVRDNERHFSIQPLLDRIMVKVDNRVVSIGAELERFIAVSVCFGADVLGCPIQTVQCEAAKPEKDQLTPLQISMDHILSQLDIQMQLKAGTLKKLVEHQKEIGNLNEKYQDCYTDIKSGKTLSDEDADFCLVYGRAHGPILKNIRSRDLSNSQVREQELNEFLDILVMLCDAEEINLEGTSMLNTKYQVMAAWCFQVDPITAVHVPDMLYLELTDEHATEVCSSRDACCPYCHKAISKHFGAYPQKIIGVLGGQSTGKTTYMAAFADVLDHTSLDDLPFTISYEPESDAQWRRFQASAKDGNFGAMWAYQNGYNAQKTDLQSESAVSLSFLVSPKEKGKIPTIYVLADIPGEALDGLDGNKINETLDNSRKIFRYCQAKFMTLSCDPKDAKIAASKFIGWIRDFSKFNMPSAFLITKFDRSEKKPAVPLAFHLGQMEYQPYVRGKGGVGVYNIDRMSTLCRYAKRQEDLLSENLYTNMLNEMQKEVPEATDIALNTFLLSSGTADYIDFITEDTEEKRRDRVSVARNERYGVLAPILWILALDGYIEPGRCGDELLSCSAAAEAQLKKLWKKELYRPEGVD